MTFKPDYRQHQTGVVLLEALLAILIFSLGILALVALQATAIKQSTDAKYRSEAALLANDIIGQMWVGDRTIATLQANFNSPGGATYYTWKARVSGLLPGVASNAPTINVDAQGIVTVTIFWIAPSEPAGTAAHQYVARAQIKSRDN